MALSRLKVFPQLKHAALVVAFTVCSSPLVYAQRGDSQTPGSQPPKSSPRQSTSTAPAPFTQNLPELPRVFSQSAPQSLQDLQDMETWVRNLVDEVRPFTVGLILPSTGSLGSGVIVTEDGYVLTAGHVIGRKGEKVKIVFMDGKELEAVSLGVIEDMDCGLVKIDNGKNLPHAKIAPSNHVKAGDWCTVLGHPGGYTSGREPVVRLGRVLDTKKFIQTDCTIVAGDSGGPLFDMYGRVIGINKSIWKTTQENFHVPIGEYLKNWETLTR